MIRLLTAVVLLAGFGECLPKAGAEEPAKIWGEAVCVAVSGDGRRVAAAYLGADNRAASKATEPPTIFVWDVAGGAPIARLSGHHEPVTVIALSSDGRKLVSGDMAFNVRVWDVDGGKESKLLERSGSVAISVACAPRGNLAAVTTGDGVYVWDVGPAEPKRAAILGTPWGARERNNDRTLSVAFSPDGKRLAAATPTWLYMWDVAGTEFTRRRRAKLSEDEAFSCVGFAVDGKQAVTCDWSGTNFVIWDLEGDEPKPLSGLPRVDRPSRPEPTSLTLLPSGKRVLYVNHRVEKAEPFNFDGARGAPLLIPQGYIGLHDVKTDQVALSFNAYHGVLARDGKTLVTTGDGVRREQVVMWELNGDERKEIRVYSPPATK